MATVTLAVRVARLEEQVRVLANELAQVKRQLAQANATEPDLSWWEKRWGIFDNDPDYEKAMELGRQYRESLRPKPRKRNNKMLWMNRRNSKHS